MTRKYKNIVGIDLGTTNVVFALLTHEGGKINYTVREGPTGDRNTPSIVCFNSNGETLIGIPARNNQTKEYNRTVFGSKRLLGRKRGNKELEEFLSKAPFQYDFCKDGSPIYVIPKVGDIERKVYKPEQISALLLGEIRDDVKRITGSYPDACVITVPAYFNENQCNATLTAAKIAELNCVKIIREPTAAAIAFRQKAEFDSGTILVFDFGGGTLDVSILSVEGNDYTVKGVSGDINLGGELIDEYIVNFLIKQISGKYNIEIGKDDKRELAILRKHAIEAKHALTFSEMTDVIISNFKKGIDVEVRISRFKLEDICEPLFDRLEKPIDVALKNAGLEINDIDHVIMVGGSSQIPAVKEKVEDKLEDEELEPQYVDVDQAVAIGALIVCDKISLGEINADPKKHISTGINIIDKIPLAIGLRHNEDRFIPFIKANADMPTEKVTHRFRPGEEEATSALIEIYQGNDSIISSEETSHVKLREFEIEDLPLKGNRDIIINMCVDENGLLSLSCDYDGGRKHKEIDFNLFEAQSAEGISASIAEQKRILELRELRNKMVEIREEFGSEVNRIKPINHDKYLDYKNTFDEWVSNVPKDKEGVLERTKEIEKQLKKIKKI